MTVNQVFDLAREVVTFGFFDVIFYSALLTFAVIVIYVAFIGYLKTNKRVYFIAVISSIFVFFMTLLLCLYQLVYSFYVKNQIDNLEIKYFQTVKNQK